MEQGVFELQQQRNLWLPTTTTHVCTTKIYTSHGHIWSVIYYLEIHEALHHQHYDSIVIVRENMALFVKQGKLLFFAFTRPFRQMTHCSGGGGASLERKKVLFQGWCLSSFRNDDPPPSPAWPVCAAAATAAGMNFLTRDEIMRCGQMLCFNLCMTIIVIYPWSHFVSLK